MYTDQIARLPKSFREQHVRKIVNELQTNRSLTLVGPSGFGKSSILRFLAYKRGLGRKYSNLKNTLVIYVTLTSFILDIETLNRQANMLSSPIDYNALVMQLLLRPLKDGVKLHLSSTFNPDENDFFAYTDKLLKQHRKLRLFFVLDNIEGIFSEQHDLVRNVIKSIRDQYTPSIEYIFPISNTENLDIITRNKIGKLADLMGHKISTFPLRPIAKSVYYSDLQPNWFKYHLWTKWKSEFTNKMKILNEVTGGFPPYIKFLLREKELSKINFASPELIIDSDRLANSLTPSQLSVLSYVATKAKNHNLNQSNPDVILLQKLGLISPSVQHSTIFSPIFSHYLRHRNTEH